MKTINLKYDKEKDSYILDADAFSEILIKYPDFVTFFENLNKNEIDIIISTLEKLLTAHQMTDNQIFSVLKSIEISEKKIADRTIPSAAKRSRVTETMKTPVSLKISFKVTGSFILLYALLNLSFLPKSQLT